MSRWNRSHLLILSALVTVTLIAAAAVSLDRDTAASPASAPAAVEAVEASAVN